MTRAGRIFALFSLWTFANSALWASPQHNAVLGANGEVYIARAGTYGELFPDGKAVDSSYPVLALEVTTPDGKRERTLVEGTEGPGEDSLPFLHFEDSSQTVFLLWETRFNVVHPILMLSGYNGKWTEPLEIIGNPFAPKTSPQFAVTQDVLEDVGEDGNPVARRRTVLNLVWGEELPNGSIEAFYLPVILDDGVLIGRSTKAFRLADFDRSEVADSELSPALGEGLAIRSGKDERTLVVAFPSPRTHRLVTVEIDSLPAQLGRLSDEARMHIIETGLRHYPAGYKQVADFARMHIIETGGRFQPEVTQAIAAQVAQLILDNKGLDKLEVIADRARMHIIETGAKLSDRGLRTGTSTVEIRETQTDAATHAHLLGFKVFANWPAPEISGKSVRFFPARSGKALLVAWPSNGKIQYLETQDGGWSRVKEMILSPTLDLNRAYQILEDRMSRN